ncbi:MAG: hypothetical protein PHE25_03550 [Candidatus Gracilibacteria bacterium]|nr:hypothetical protein [Candidatus Gracilibacteria bacterium]
MTSETIECNPTETNIKGIHKASNFKEALDIALKDKTITEQEAMALLKRLNGEKKEQLRYTRSQAHFLVSELGITGKTDGSWMSETSFKTLLNNLASKYQDCNPVHNGITESTPKSAGGKTDNLSGLSSEQTKAIKDISELIEKGQMRSSLAEMIINRDGVIDISNVCILEYPDGQKKYIDNNGNIGIVEDYDSGYVSVHFKDISDGKAMLPQQFLDYITNSISKENERQRNSRQNSNFVEKQKLRISINFSEEVYSIHPTSFQEIYKNARSFLQLCPKSIRNNFSISNDALIDTQSGKKINISRHLTEKDIKEFIKEVVAYQKQVQAEQRRIIEEAKQSKHIKEVIQKSIDGVNKYINTKEHLKGLGLSYKLYPNEKLVGFNLTDKGGWNIDLGTIPYSKIGGNIQKILHERIDSVEKTRAEIEERKEQRKGQYRYTLNYEIGYINSLAKDIEREFNSHKASNSDKVGISVSIEDTNRPKILIKKNGSSSVREVSLLKSNPIGLSDFGLDFYGFNVNSDRLNSLIRELANHATKIYDAHRKL